VYLTYSNPRAITSDNFINVETLELDTYFNDYVREAFKPVGVYLNFWQPTLKSKSAKRFVVMMINDKDKSVDGSLEFSIENSKGEKLLTKTEAFHLNKFGQNTYYVDVVVPDYEGDCLIKATAKYNNQLENTLSRRKVRIEK
ncbi:MAG: hypothetical protein HC905_28485, partial [Bacteroidales bacterium]|nr:hypothetical protein [Bacteroidales bacterium]